MQALLTTARRVLLIGALALPFACEEDEEVSTAIIHPMLVSVSPEDFLGTLPCLDAPGAMRTYVAVLRHRGPADDDGVAGEHGYPQGVGGEGGAPAGIDPAESSPLLACTSTIGFGMVRPDHRYLADVYAFDRDDLELATPAGDLGPWDAPVVIDEATGDPVAPRWTTRCAAITARQAIVRRFHDCEPLTDHAPGGPAVVEVNLDTLAGVECGVSPGQIERFDVTGPAGVVSVACGETLTFEDLPAGQSLVMPVLAYEAGVAEATFGTTCTADVHAGVTVTASCDPLTDEGALEVDPAAAASALGLDCSTLAELTLQYDDAPPRRVLPSDCHRPVQFPGIARGVQSVSAVAMLSDGSTSGEAACTGSVVPAQRVVATCAAVP